MKKSLWILIAMGTLFASCTKPFKKAKDGSEYRIIENSGGKKAVTGNYMELNTLVKYKDSVVFSSLENGSPSFIPYDTAQLPPFLHNLHEGDSIIIRIKTDTLIKRNQAAPFMKKGQYLYQYFKIAKLYADKAASDVVATKYAALAKEKAFKKTTDQITKDLTTVNAAQLKTDDGILKEYIAKNALQATKTTWGTYVVINTPGEGDNLTQQSILSVNYTGKTLKDTVFDSNTDPKFGHVQPFTVHLDEYSVIPGWIDGLKQFKKGSKGKILIPSSLGYGKNGSAPKIGPDENLVFDIEVVDVMTPEQYRAKQEVEQKAMMEAQQKMMEEQKNKQQDQPQQQPAGTNKTGK